MRAGVEIREDLKIPGRNLAKRQVEMDILAKGKVKESLA